MRNEDVKNKCFDSLSEFVEKNSIVNVKTGLVEKPILVALKDIASSSTSEQDCIVEMLKVRALREHSRNGVQDGEIFEEEIKIGTSIESKEKMKRTQNSLFSEEIVEKYLDIGEKSVDENNTQDR